MGLGPQTATAKSGAGHEEAVEKKNAVLEDSESDLGTGDALFGQGLTALVSSGVEPAQSSEDEVQSAGSSESSDSSADSDTQFDVVDKPAPISQEQELDVPGPCWLNKRSHTIHKVGMSDHVTYCGRRTLKGSFKFSAEGASSLNPRCSVCYKGELITTRLGMAKKLDEMEAKRQPIK